ncbi:helix-turn-helix domain-containing protein [Paenibacillus sp. CMAA1364]
MKRIHRLKAPFKKNSFLVQIFIGLSLISIIIVSIISIVMFYMMKNKSIEEINKINRMALQNTDTVFTSYLKSFQNYSIELYQNPNIRKVMFLDELEWDSGMENAVTHIQNILSVNRDIMNSVYVLNNTKTILSISEKFADSDANLQLFQRVSGHRAGESPMVWNMRDKYSGNDIKTMSFFFHQGVQGSLGGAAVINVDLEALSKTLFSEKTNKNQKMFIVDRAGNVVLHSDKSLGKQNIMSDSYFTTMLHSNKSYDSFILGSENKAVSYSYITSTNDRYFIVSEMESVHTLSEMVKTRNVIVMSGMLMFMLSLFVAGIISYYVYKPFGHVIKNIRSVYQEESTGSHQVDELQLVSNAFTSIVERNHSLEKENDNHTFVKMLNSDRNEDALWIEIVFMKTGSIQTRDTPYGVFVVTIDEFDDFSEMSNVEAVSFRIDSVITLLTETINLRAQCALFTVAADQLLCIISNPHVEIPLDNAFMLDTAKNAQQSVLNMLNMDISIGISSIVNRPSMIIEKYNEALEVTRHRIVEGTRWIADAEYLRTLETMDIPDSAAKDVVNAVMRGDYEQYCKELDRVATYSRDYHYSSIIRFFSHMSSSIMKLSHDLLVEETIKNKTTFFEIYKKVSEFKEYSELKAWFQELFHQSSDVIQDILSKKTKDFLPESLEYINQYYCDPSISVNSVAERLKVSTSYFSKMFNESMGYTFPEYVNHLRMEKANELLQDYPEMNITDISTKVGYSSNSYFTTSFKKKYGVSPSKMRLLHKS